MSKGTRRSIRTWVYGGSVFLHAALAVGAVLLPKPERAPESVAIELAEIRKKNTAPKPPPPPPPPPPEKPKPPPPPHPPPQAKVGPEPAKAEAPPPEEATGDGYTDLGGIALGNAGGGEGPAIAVAAKPAGAAPGAPTARPTTRKVRELAAPAPDAPGTMFVYATPKVRFVPKKEDYPLKALQAEIEGVVRIEVTVDETGRVIGARVLEGLGYGLDEVALQYAKKWLFEPATRAGRPVISTKKIPFRFSLQ